MEDKLHIGGVGEDSEPACREDTPTAPVAEPRTALEFEIVSEEECGLVFDSEADISPELTTDRGEEHHDTSSEGEPEVAHEEFSVPESFEVNPKYDTQSFIEDPIRVRTTYVPRFTEVSENYRMADDPRPREVTDAVRTASAPQQGRRGEDVSGDVDPTAELDEARTVEKVIVTSSPVGNTEPADESIKVFKFVSASEEDSTEEAVSESLEDAVTDALGAIPDTAEESVPEEPDESEAAPGEAEPFAVDDIADSYETSGIECGLLEEEAPLVALEPKKRRAFSLEFSTPIQRDSFKDRFLDTIMSVRVRLIASLVLLVGMLVLDFLAYFSGFSITELISLGGIDGAMAFVDLQLSLCLVLLAMPELIRAVRYLLCGKVLPEIGIIPSALILILYTVLVFVDGAEDYHLFGVLVGAQTVAAIVGAYFRTSADFLSFKLVSKNGVKRVLDKRLTRTLPRENMALDGVVDEYDSNCSRSFRTAFVSDFFERCDAVRESSSTVVFMMALSLGIALVSSVVYYFTVEGAIFAAAGTGAMVFLVSYPAFSSLVHKLPLHHAEGEAACEGGCFVGEESIYSAAEIDVITFDDVDVFTDEDVSIKKVHLYGKVENMGRAMKQMYALFSAIGGPLDKVFERALDRKCAPATDISIEEDGVSGSVLGERVCAGSADYMLRHGISIPASELGAGSGFTDSTRIMYGSADGEVYVKFALRYSFSEEFTMLLPVLREQGIVPLVYTCDPNVSDELIKVLTLGEDVMRIMKRTVPFTTEGRVYRKLSSGIVSRGEKGSLVNLVLLAKRYVALMSHMKINQVIATVAGAVIALAFAFTGISVFPASAFCVLQLAWCVYLYFRTRLTFDTKPKGKE